MNTAPSGTTPWVTKRHKATSSLRASATMAIRRTRPFAAPTRARNQRLNAESGWWRSAFLEQRAALARQAAAILVFRARRANHRTDPPLAASPRHQRPQQRLAIDRIGLDPPMPPGRALPEAASTPWLSIPSASSKR